MAVAIMCFGVAELVEFLFRFVFLLYLWLGTKAAKASVIDVKEVRELQKMEKYYYNVNVEYNGQQARGILIENVKEGYFPKCVPGKLIDVRFNGKKCFIIGPTKKHALRSFLIAAGCIAGSLLMVAFM